MHQKQEQPNPQRELVNRRKFITSSIGLLAASTLASRPLIAGSARVVSKSRSALGSKVAIKVIHPNAKIAEQAITNAFDRIERVEQAMNLYRPHSEISILNSTGILSSPSSELLTVLRAAQALSKKTKGVFDVTIQPLWELYKNHQEDGTQPPATAIEARMERLGWNAISVADHEIRFANAHSKITLNGIAQGYATDQATQALKRAGIQHALIDCGELGAIGKNGDSRAWTIGIQDPRQADAFAALASLDNRSLATSGDYETHFTSDFKNHHIFDPRTGRSPLEIASASVLAPSAMQADALSTTMMVLGVRESFALIRSLKKVDALLITKDGRQLSTAEFPLKA